MMIIITIVKSKNYKYSRRNRKIINSYNNDNSNNNNSDGEVQSLLLFIVTIIIYLCYGDYKDWFVDEEGDADFGDEDDNNTTFAEQDNNNNKNKNKDREISAIEDLQFPDEVQTPQDQTARRRFQKVIIK